MLIGAKRAEHPADVHESIPWLVKIVGIWSGVASLSALEFHAEDQMVLRSTRLDGPAYSVTNACPLATGLSTALVTASL